MKIIVTFQILFFLLFYCPQFARAEVGVNLKKCECQLPTVSKAVVQASAIFIGNVESIKENPLHKGLRQIKFRLIRKLKGLEELPTEVIVAYTPKEEQKCGYNFQQFADYLVYVNGPPARFQTNKCTRNAYFETSKAEVKKIADLVSVDK